MDELNFNWNTQEHESGPERIHLNLIVSGEEIGEAIIEHYKEPFDFYYVEDLSVRKHKRGQSYGTQIVRQINEFLDNKKALGFLKDAIKPDSPAVGLYEKNGWISLKEWDEFLIYGRNSTYTPKEIMEAARSI